MKNTNIKRLVSIIIVMLTAMPLIVSAGAGLESNADEASVLLENINNARSSASMPPLKQDAGLDKVAADYANILYAAGSDFRKSTDFLTLPSGERVITLLKLNNVFAWNFYYSVWMGSWEIEKTPEFQNKAVNGNYECVGIASCTSPDGFKVVILVFGNITLPTPAASSGNQAASGY